MNVRRAIVITGAGLCAGMPQARAQTMRQRRIAILSNALPSADMAGTDPANPTVRALVHGLRGLGHIEGHNLAIDGRSAEGRLERVDTPANAGSARRIPLRQQGTP